MRPEPAPKAGWMAWLLPGLLLPLLADGYALRICTVFYLYLLLALGLSIIVNYAGLLNLGIVAFYAVGAYTYAVLNKSFGVSFWVALPVGALAAAALAFVLGFPTLRVRGDYLALVTLGIGEIARTCLINIWGPHGIPGIAPPLPPALIGGSANLGVVYYAVAFVSMVLAALLVQWLDGSRVARRWLALRDNETAARACGISPFRSLLFALVLGSAFAGAAGVIFAGMQRYVSPGSFVLDESILVLSIVVIAGGRSLQRLALAAALLIVVPELLRGLAEYRMLIFGSILAAWVVIEERLKPTNPSALPTQPETESALEALAGPLPDLFLPRPEETPLHLEIEHLTKRFGGATALREISLTLTFDRSVIGLIGPNGAGKTTLFNCISGVVRATSGTIRFPDLPAAHTADEAARAGIARTFQTPQMFSSMTIRENVAMGGVGCGRPLTGEQVDRLLAHFNLRELADRDTTSQPLGTQRMVELARALAMKPRLVLLDEIAAGLGSAEKQKLAATIRQLADRTNISFLVVEHDMQFILPLAKEVIVLDAGRLLARGTPEQISADPAVIKAYLGGNHAAAA